MTTVGDVGYVDDDGFLYLTDRKTFMIISGGVNIYPQETENLLITHPKVADAAVFGVPNADLGEEVKAVVQPMPGVDGRAALAEELLASARSTCRSQKCPAPSTSSTSCRACRPASSTSGSCATSTGARASPASCDRAVEHDDIWSDPGCIGGRVSRRRRRGPDVHASPRTCAFRRLDPVRASHEQPGVPSPTGSATRCDLVPPRSRGRAAAIRRRVTDARPTPSTPATSRGPVPDGPCCRSAPTSGPRTRPNGARRVRPIRLDGCMSVVRCRVVVSGPSGVLHRDSLSGDGPAARCAWFGPQPGRRHRRGRRRRPARQGRRVPELVS